MPDGRVQRIDDRRGVAYIVRKGRTYPAELSEVEGRARVPSARVRFDLIRHRGEEEAANVRLRSGTRTGRRQRRFGDLTGARMPGAKTTTSAALYGVDVTTQPMRVVRAWAAAMGRSDHDAASFLALPDVVFHSPAGDGGGRRHFRAVLERSTFDGVDAAEVELSALDRLVRIESPSDQGTLIASFVVDHGAIAEAWLEVEPDDEPEREATGDEPSIEVVRLGDVGAGEVARAERKLMTLMDRNASRAVAGRAKLTRPAHLGGDRPALVEMVVDLGGSTVRSRAEAPTFAEAVEAAADRLRARLETGHDRRRHRAAGLDAEPGQWRRGNRRRPSRVGYDRPRSEREIVRHKSFAPERVSVDEAVWDMALLDYDFFLFVDDANGIDSLLERGEAESLLLHRADPAPDGASAPPDRASGEDPDGGTGAAVSVVTDPVPELSVPVAVELLDGADRDLVFFVNNRTGRANVLYRRLDGHYGLITPPASSGGMAEADAGRDHRADP